VRRRLSQHERILHSTAGKFYVRSTGAVVRFHSTLG
jgi:ribosomal protein L24E